MALLFTLLAVACGGAPSDLADDDPDAAGVPPLPDAAAGSVSSIDPARIMADVEVLASDGYAGREPGTAGGDLALDYVEARFEELALVPAGDDDGYRQQFSFGEWEQTDPTVLTLAGGSLTDGSDHIMLEGSGSGTVSAEVVFVGYGLTVPAYSRDDYPACPIAESGYDDYAGIDVTGKVALVLRHGPSDNEAIHEYCPATNSASEPPVLWSFGYKAGNARSHGAAAMLLVQDYRHNGDAFEGTISTEYVDAAFPAVTVDRDIVEGHVTQLASWATAIDTATSPDSHATGLTASLATYAATVGQTSANLLAVLPGTDPEIGDEVIIIGGHLDHVGSDGGDIYNGADDNASGTAVVMELARVAVESGLEPARTVMFAAFNAEELGLYGSCHLAQTLAFPTDKVVAMISVDMVGAGNGKGLDLYGAGDAKDAWLAELMQATAAEIALPYTTAVAEELLASDHACFVWAGVSAVLASTPGPHAYYHTPEDTAATILSEDLEASASLLWVTLQALANGVESSYLAGRGRAVAPATKRRITDPRRARRRY